MRFSPIGLILLTSCASDPTPVNRIADTPPRPVTLSFAATVLGAPARCNQSYQAIGKSERTVELADARLFVSAIELENEAGDWVPLTLDPVSAWQTRAVALLDFENQSGACSDSGTPETNTHVAGYVPEGTYEGLRFQVAVPEALNHQNGTLATAPLNVPGMFWTWQTGYKFLRVDWSAPGGPIPRWNIHLGSSGCKSPAAVTSPDEPCARQNRPNILLPTFHPDSDRIVIDLAALAHDVDLDQNASSTAPGCMVGPNDALDCAPVFRALSLQFATGGCFADCQKQTVFSVEAL